MRTYQNFSVILPRIVYDLPQLIEHLFLGQNSAIAQGQVVINDTRVEHLWFGKKKYINFRNLFNFFNRSLCIKCNTRKILHNLDMCWVFKLGRKKNTNAFQDLKFKI